MKRAARAGEIERYLRTGDHDPLFAAWPGNHLLEKASAGSADLSSALVAEAERRARGRTIPESVPAIDLVALARRKVEPMVRGLFPRSEQEAVIGLLERSIVFLTPDRIASILRGRSFPHSAWMLANLYLVSLGAEPLSADAPRIVGMSEETTCFVSVEYFDAAEQGPFEDFVVHEAAHVFHSCKRRTIALRESPRRGEWLLDIAFRKREMFAYACEAYSRILERATRPADRRALAKEAAGNDPPDDSVDPEEYASILRAATAARTRLGGFRAILDRCAERWSPRTGRNASTPTSD